MSRNARTGLHRSDTTDASTADLPCPSERQLVSLAGGVLVYRDEPDRVGRVLVGFADVTDEDALAEGLRARGLGTGALDQLPEFELTIVADGGYVPDGDRTCARCESEAVEGSRFCPVHTRRPTQEEL